ncbi:MAG: hypothetical protein ACT6RF_09110 [Allorhizobium sp.]|uniref:hypothetical protein n=1 Tax=Allorhizobium sp. TaxID=633478 RepID=UPI004034DD54
MREDQIATFVEEMLETGATLYAIADYGYFLGDIDAPDDKVPDIAARVNEVCERYGPRDHLRHEISAHLRSIGRYVEVEDVSRSKSWLSRFVLRRPAARIKGRRKATLN